MDSTKAGPVDVVMLRFPGNEFNGGIAPALVDPVKKGVIRVLDLLFVYKDTDGTVGSIELAGLGPELEPTFVDIDGQFPGGLLDAEDVDEVAGDLEPGSSMAVLAVENLWAVPFIEAVRASGGELVDQVRVPSEVVDAVRGTRAAADVGLIGGMARTAVVAGTATAVSNRVSRRQAARWNQQADAQAYQSQQYAQPAYAAPPPQPAPVAAPAGADTAAEIQKLGTLHDQGLITDEEFAAAKKKLLGI